MAISLSFFPVLSLLLVSLATLSSAKVVTHDFNITWVQANPDGKFSRPTIGINGAWPLPVIRVDVGDNLIVNVNNQLGNQTTTLHWHGIYMNGTSHMDGAMQVSQCGINPGSKFTYNFTINQPGTYWYHSHAKGQYPDGLRAPLIVTDPNAPFEGQYDEEIVLSVSDWYHDQMQALIPKFMSRFNPTGAEPVPNAALFNDTQNLTIAIKPGKTYLFRMVNIGAFAGQYVWFENHTMSIVEVDGIYTQPADASMLYLSAAQRYSFLITAKNDTSSNYAFVGSMDTSLFDVLPPNLNFNVTGWLVYDSAKNMPAPELVDELESFDDFTLLPYDNKTLLAEPDRTIELRVAMDNLGDGANYAFFNNITYTPPIVPTLYTVMSSGANASKPGIYGAYTHSFVLEKDEVIDIVVNNDDPGKHPFHLHGHAFQVIVRSDEEAGFYNATEETDFPATPMRRDTVVVNPNGHLVIRFQADNPGVWLFHCHIEWHVDSGLIATFIEAPTVLQDTLSIPADHIAACVAAGTPYAGNAAGNTVNLLDLSGQRSPPAPLPEGFTPRGIVALTFSILAALIGLAVISWYGLADMGAAGLESEKRRIAAAANIAARATKTVG